MRKLRIMEKSQGIWTMECQILIDSKYLVVYDKKNAQEVEIFPMELVCDPTSVISDDKKDIYNNILLFTVMEDYKKKSVSPNIPTTPTEMHIFQCIQTHSAEIVDEIYKIKESKAAHPSQHSAPLNHSNHHDVNKAHHRQQQPQQQHPIDHKVNTNAAENGNGLLIIDYLYRF